jgi:hypothetical protein
MVMSNMGWKKTVSAFSLHAPVYDERNTCLKTKGKLQNKKLFSPHPHLRIRSTYKVRTTNAIITCSSSVQGYEGCIFDFIPYLYISNIDLIILTSEIANHRLNGNFTLNFLHIYR